MCCLQSAILRNMVNDNKSWPEIAGIMKKSERQVKYQWCHLLSREYNVSSTVLHVELCVPLAYGCSFYIRMNFRQILHCRAKLGLLNRSKLLCPITIIKKITALSHRSVDISMHSCSATKKRTNGNELLHTWETVEIPKCWGQSLTGI